MRKIAATLFVVLILDSFTFKAYSFETTINPVSQLGKETCQNMFLKSHNGENNFITIMFNGINGISYYYKYDIKANTYETIFSKQNTCYSDGFITKDGSTLYYTDKNLGGSYNLYKMKTTDNFHHIIQLTKNINIDMFCLGNNEVFCRATKKGDRYCNITILDLFNNKLNICYKNQPDFSVFKLEYNQFTHKIYTIEQSIKDMHSLHMPNYPRNKIVEYDENGKEIKDLFEIKGVINNISISKDGSYALVSITQDIPPLSTIYAVELNNSSKKRF